MSPITAALTALEGAVAELTSRHGRRVDVACLELADRVGQLPLGPPGLQSPNRACRLFQAADGWMALNLAREEDHDLLPAWFGCDGGGDPWTLVMEQATRHACDDLIDVAARLGLPACIVGEVRRPDLRAPVLRRAEGLGGHRRTDLRVVDLSALWAGPFAGAILAAMGARVIKVESLHRPDPTRTSTPEFFRRLNGGKRDLQLDLRSEEDRLRLRDAVLTADILITSARPRAFVSLGLEPERVFSDNPGLVWAAITGYGWEGAAGTRVAFGDDAAAAGGLVSWTPDGAPRFLGDALADPVTGLAAAEGALRGLEEGGGMIVDASLAAAAAGAAALCGWVTS